MSSNDADILSECGMAEMSWSVCMVAHCEPDELHADVLGGECRPSTCFEVEVSKSNSLLATDHNTLSRYFSTRAVTILLDVLIFSFSWSVIVVTLLHIRGWFPFKVKVSPIHFLNPGSDSVFL